MSGELRATRTPYACYLSKPCHPTPFQARCALFGELNERLEDMIRGGDRGRGGQGGEYGDGRRGA